MLSIPIIEEIDRLLHEGQLTQRSIAGRLGVSRGTVNAIARGRRALFGRNYHDDGASNKPPPRHDGPPARCSLCGYFVYMPCRICQSRAYDDRRRALRVAALRYARIPRTNALSGVSTGTDA